MVLIALVAYLGLIVVVAVGLAVRHGRCMSHCIVAGCRAPRERGYKVCGGCLDEILAAEGISTAIDGKLRPHPRLTLMN